MADEKVGVQIVADASQAKAEFGSFAATVAAVSASAKSAFAGIQTGGQALASQMSSTMGNVTSVIGSLQGRFVALAAILAGGKVFKEAVQATATFTKEAVALSKALGINTTDASALNVALGDVGGSAEDMTGAAGKLAKQLRTNEDQLVSMGLKTRDANGHFRNMQDLLMDSIKVVNGYAEGTDRTMAKQTMFGKGAEELGSIFKLNNAVVDAAKVKQQELGLVVGVENVEAAKRYRAMMNDVGDVLLALKKAIGDAVMPILTRFGEWFADIAPPAIYACKVALDAMATAVHAVTLVVREAWVAITTLADPIATFGRALRLLISGDMSGATREMQNIFSNWGDAFSSAGDRMKAEAQRTWTDITALWSKPTPTAPMNETEGKHFQPKTQGQDKSRMGEWEAALAAEREAYEQQQDALGTLRQFSLQQEADYWKQILALDGLSEAERAAATRRYYAATRQVRREDFEASQAELQTRISATRSNYDEQEMLADMYVAQAAKKYGEDSKEYQTALKFRQGIYRAHLEATQQISNVMHQAERDAQLDDVAAMERGAQLELTLGTITQEQLLDVKRRALVMREQIELEAKQAELQAQIGGINDPVQVEKIQAEIAAIRRKYAGLQSQNNGDKVTTQAKPFDAVFGASQTAIENGLTSMVTKMKLTLGGIKDVAKQVGASLLEELAVKPVAAWLVSQARMVVMTALFGEQRVALEAATGAEITAVQGASSLKTIAMKAYEAAAGAYSAIAGIPYVGPVLAPIAAGVALAGVMAFASNIFSAEGGFDIPRGLNPMVQAHSNEMILPSKYADVIRGLANGEGGGGMTVHVHQTISTIDARGMDEAMLKNRSSLIKAIQHAKRNFEI